jgi:hypothetical protein
MLNQLKIFFLLLYLYAFIQPASIVSTDRQNATHAMHREENFADERSSLSKDDVNI